MGVILLCVDAAFALAILFWFFRGDSGERAATGGPPLAAAVVTPAENVEAPRATPVKLPMISPVRLYGARTAAQSDAGSRVHVSPGVGMAATVGEVVDSVTAKARAAVTPVSVAALADPRVRQRQVLLTAAGLGVAVAVVSHRFGVL